jgi:hypothetical protein
VLVNRLNQFLQHHHPVKKSLSVIEMAQRIQQLQFWHQTGLRIKHMEIKWALVQHHLVQEGGTVTMEKLRQMEVARDKAMATAMVKQTNQLVAKFKNQALNPEINQQTIQNLQQIQKKMKVMRRVKEGENNSKSLNHQNLQVEMAVKTNRL